MYKTDIGKENFRGVQLRSASTRCSEHNGRGIVTTLHSVITLCSYIISQLHYKLLF